MTRDNVLVVFVSSDMKELKKERKAAIDAVQDLQFIPEHFERWGASPKSPRNVMLEKVRSSDVYIGIVWRKFSKPTKDEYQEAVENEIPTLVYVKNAKDADRDPRLMKFLGSIEHSEEGQIYKEFTNSRELKECIKDNLRVLQAFEVRGRREPESRITVIGLKEFDIKSVESLLEPLFDLRIESPETRKDLWNDLRNEFPSLGRRRTPREEVDVLLKVVEMALQDIKSPEYVEVCINILSLISSNPSNRIKEEIRKNADLVLSFNVGDDWDLRRYILRIQRNIAKTKKSLTRILIKQSIHEWNDDEFSHLNDSIRLEDLRDKKKEYNSLLRLRSKLEIEGGKAKVDRTKKLLERLRRYLD